MRLPGYIISPPLVLYWKEFEFWRRFEAQLRDLIQTVFWSALLRPPDLPPPPSPSPSPITSPRKIPYEVV